jgi:hypothetical protein
MIALACRITLSLIFAITTSTAFQARPRLVLGSSVSGRIPLVQERIPVVAKKSPLFLAAPANNAIPQSVEVCKSKDCRRRGGAQRLLGQIQAVRIVFRSLQKKCFFLNA